MNESAEVMDEQMAEKELQPTELDWLLARDLRQSAAKLTPTQVRYLVDLYYQLQEHRIASQNMVRAQTGEPNGLLSWFADRLAQLEASIPHAMRVYAKSRRDGRWALSIHGIGPVLAAGLLAYIDIERAPTVGHIWRFFGLDPTCKWGKGEKRPHCAAGKVLCWKIGQSFMKLRGGKNDVYGKVYEARKQYEVERNEAGGNAGYDLRGYAEFRKQIGVPRGPVDRLPPGVIDARARRYAVKLFLSHLHHVMYECRYGTAPPKPYIITHGGHAHFMAPPKWPCE